MRVRLALTNFTNSCSYIQDGGSSNEMTEELLTSRFGSHESVCKPDQPDLGQVMSGRVVETGKVD